MTTRAKYGNAAFRRGKSASATANRLCFETKLYLEQLDDKPSSFYKIEAAFNKYRERIHNILRGQHRLSRLSNTKQEIAAAFVQDELPSVVLVNLHRFDFEVSKEWITVLSHVLVEVEQQLADSLHVTIPYLISNYRHTKLSMICGQFFRDLVGFPSHQERCLNLDILKALAEYAMTDHFEISSDASESLKALIVGDNEFVGVFLQENYSEVTTLFSKMLSSGYFFKRQTLNLLYRILSLPNCESFTEKYVEDSDNLKYIMNQLRDDSKHIQMEAFHLFSVIVNHVLSMPHRPTVVLRILSKNNDKLIDFFENFQLDRGNS
jgi:calcium binding protein 39